MRTARNKIRVLFIGVFSFQYAEMRCRVMLYSILHDKRFRKSESLEELLASMLYY